MNRALFAVTFLMLALPGSTENCLAVEIEHTSGGPVTRAYSGPLVHSAEVQTDIIGHFLWVNYGEAPEGGHEWEGAVSIDVSDPTITGATICLDGTVTFNYETPESLVVDLVETFPEIDLVPDAATWEWARPGGVAAF